MEKTDQSPPTYPGPVGCDRTDGEVLEHFTATGDEAAFSALVQRFGPLVLSVCRRVLRHEQDAEDAFQSTFLVLARKAASIGKHEAVGSWLYGVAYRIARKAKSQRARRQVHETDPPGDIPEAERTPAWIWHELRDVIDAEVSYLPRKYREPFVLYYLEGKTKEQAARELACPLGTIMSRLARARDRLRERLTRRGVVLSTGMLAAVVSGQAAPAAVPAGLAVSTGQAALLFLAGQPAGAGVISTGVVSLAEDFLKALYVAKLKMAGSLLALVLGTITLVVLLAMLPGDQPKVDGEGPPPFAAAGNALTDRENLQGNWKVTTATFGGQIFPDGDIKMVFAGNRCDLVFQGGQARTLTITYTLDPSTNPKTIDLTNSGGKTARGIYRLDGDRLQLCYGDIDEERPAEFASKPGSRTLLYILQREPAAGKQDGPPPDKGP